MKKTLQLLYKEVAKLYENDISRIINAQQGNQEEMTKLIEENNRTYMEHSKKICR